MIFDGQGRVTYLGLVAIFDGQVRVTYLGLVIKEAIDLCFSISDSAAFIWHCFVWWVCLRCNFEALYNFPHVLSVGHIQIILSRCRTWLHYSLVGFSPINSWWLTLIVPRSCFHVCIFALTWAVIYSLAFCCSLVFPRTTSGTVFRTSVELS